MTRLFDADWLDRRRRSTDALSPLPGCDAVYDVVVEDEGVTMRTELRDGRIADNVVDPPSGDADFTMRMSRELFESVIRGELDPSVGFMRGEIKVVGDLGRMLSVLPATTRDGWREATAALAADTDFGR